MFRIKYNLAFERNEDGSVIVFRNEEIIATITQDDWISVITHMAFENRELGEIHRIAEMFHTGEPSLRIDEPTAI